MVQDPPDGIVPPVSRTKVAEAVAVTVPPAQVVEALGVSATVRPLGRLSISAAPLSGTVFGLVRVIVAVVGAPRATEVGLKALAMVTGLRTSRVAGAGTGLLAGLPPAIPAT